ncbi:MAG: hypothetical protein DMG06_10395 [Acidobacteria bacterium]|nr:MAG: hypothetical protein DMG06_10395 [Acidobacteriota bacterium]
MCRTTRRESWHSNPNLPDLLRWPTIPLKPFVDIFGARFSLHKSVLLKVVEKAGITSIEKSVKEFVQNRLLLVV